MIIDLFIFQCIVFNKQPLLKISSISFTKEEDDALEFLYSMWLYIYVHVLYICVTNMLLTSCCWNVFVVIVVVVVVVVDVDVVVVVAGGCESARGVADRPGGGRHPGPGPEEAPAMQVRSPLPLLQQWYVSQNPFIILFYFIF